MNSVVTARIDQKEIRELIPHSGSMCLLESVLAWDEQSILCTSGTHLNRENPLRRNQSLSAIHAFEYGAQAVAIHGGLRARSADAVAPPGYLAALRDASLNVATLDQFTDPLMVRAKSLFSDRANSVYECCVSAGNVIAAQGRVTIILRNARSSQKSNSVAGKLGSGLSRPPAFEVQCRIPAHHPSLRGHFPGEPIVPGVVVLDEIAAALTQWRQCRIRRIDFAKFLSPLKPEQGFTISLGILSDAKINFDCLTGDHLIAEGCFEIARHG
jgi:predicted hotdog family 3-hydroxylacyl-ACP dehydratase